MYQKFLIKNTDRFDPFQFPQLENSLETLVTELAGLPSAPKAEMVISYAKTQTINTGLTAKHPVLTNLISSKSLSTSVMEDLFESSKDNLLFRKDLEHYVETYLTKELNKLST